jgi:hypothetical protein
MRFVNEFFSNPPLENPRRTVGRGELITVLSLDYFWLSDGLQKSVASLLCNHLI